MPQVKSVWHLLGLGLRETSFILLVDLVTWFCVAICRRSKFQQVLTLLVLILPPFLLILIPSPCSSSHHVVSEPSLPFPTFRQLSQLISLALPSSPAIQCHISHTIFFHQSYYPWSQDSPSSHFLYYQCYTSSFGV